MERHLGLSIFRIGFGAIGLLSVFALVSYFSGFQMALFSLIALVVYAFAGTLIIHAIRLIFRKRQPFWPLFSRILLRF